MSDKRRPRRAPEHYERIIPVVLGVAVFLILLLIVLVAVVLLGVWPG